MGKEAENEYIPALFAETQDAAESYRRLLEDHDIEVLVGYDELEEKIGIVAENIESEEGIPVFVPAASLDEASEIINDFDDQDEFEEIDDDESGDDDEEDEEEFGMGSTDNPDAHADDFEGEEDEEEDEDEFDDSMLDEEDDDDDDYEFDDEEFEGFEDYDDDEDDDDYDFEKF